MAKRKTSQWRLFSFCYCSFCPTFFFWPLWILVSLMTECIFEHVWKTAVNPSTFHNPCASQAEHEYVLILSFHVTCLISPQMQLVMFKDVFNHQRHQNSQRRKEKHDSDVCFRFAVLVFAGRFSCRRHEFWCLWWLNTSLSIVSCICGKNEASWLANSSETEGWQN